MGADEPETELPEEALAPGGDSLAEAQLLMELAGLEHAPAAEPWLLEAAAHLTAADFGREALSLQAADLLPPEEPAVLVPPGLPPGADLRRMGEAVAAETLFAEDAVVQALTARLKLCLPHLPVDE